MRNNTLTEAFRLAGALLFALQADIVLQLADPKLKGGKRQSAVANLRAIRRVLTAKGLVSG